MVNVCIHFQTFYRENYTNCIKKQRLLFKFLKHFGLNSSCTFKCSFYEHYYIIYYKLSMEREINRWHPGSIDHILTHSPIYLFLSLSRQVTSRDDNRHHICIKLIVQYAENTDVFFFCIACGFHNQATGNRRRHPEVGLLHFLRNIDIDF